MSVSSFRLPILVVSNPTKLILNLGLEVETIRTSVQDSPRIPYLLDGFGVPSWKWNPHQVAQEQKKQPQPIQEGEVGVTLKAC